MQPYRSPTVYPENIGKAERHDDGFYDSVTSEDVRAQTLVQTLIGNPFTSSEDNQKDTKFYYPSNVGKLDREKIDALNEVMKSEQYKAVKIFAKMYLADHIKEQ